MSIPRSDLEVPSVDTTQMIEVDRAMIEDYHIELIQMMENADRNLAHLARVRFLDGNPVGRRVVVLAGTGGNGGGALVCARRLATWGALVQVVITKPMAEFTPVPAHQLDILQRIIGPVIPAQSVSGVAVPELVIDGLIGYSLAGAPSGSASDLIRWANRQSPPILALDAPSGVDTTTGKVYDPAIRATATLTLALPKKGLQAPGVLAHVGELYLGDISVPPGLYAGDKLALEVGPLFACSDVIRVR